MSNSKKNVCDVLFKGKCDKLSKNPQNYFFIFVISILFNYIVPLTLIISLLIIEGRNVVGNYLFYHFSSALPGIVSIYFATTTMSIVIMLVTSLIIGIGYLFYMWTQIGFYVSIPLIFEIIRWLIIIFVPEAWLIITALSLIPFMTVAVFIHFIKSKE